MFCVVIMIHVLCYHYDTYVCIVIIMQVFCVGPPSYYSTSAIDNYFTCSKTRQRDAPDIAKMGGIVCKYVHVRTCQGH